MLCIFGGGFGLFGSLYEERGGERSGRVPTDEGERTRGREWNGRRSEPFPSVDIAKDVKEKRVRLSARSRVREGARKRDESDSQKQQTKS